MVRVFLSVVVGIGSVITKVSHSRSSQVGWHKCQRTLPSVVGLANGLVRGTDHSIREVDLIARVGCDRVSLRQLGFGPRERYTCMAEVTNTGTRDTCSAALAGLLIDRIDDLLLRIVVQNDRHLG